jgi:hypothetical protein
VNPYLIQGPAIISVSGGRTSGFMLAKIIDAHGGKLPDDVIPVFCNTGLEHAATYDFLEEIGRRWTPLRWLEYRVADLGDDDDEDAACNARGKHSFVEVTAETASRAGEPFEALIRKMLWLPNYRSPKCSSELKIRTTKRFVKSLGWDHYTNAIGLRADEPHRVHRLQGEGKMEEPVCPMYVAGHDRQAVAAFWNEQPFDLRLPKNDHAFGNCVGCFKKTPARIRRVLRDEPEHADWYIRMEALKLADNATSQVFRNDGWTMAGLLRDSQQPVLFEDDYEESALPCACTE